MASKQSVDKQKSASSVIAVGETHAESTQNALVGILQPFLKKGESMPDFAAAMRLSCRALAAARDHMVQCDQAHETELADDAEVREARDEAYGVLYAQLVEVREILGGAYGSGTVNKVLAGATPQDPVMLSRYAGEVASKLDDVKLPAPRVKGAKLDTAELAGSIRANRAELDKHLEAVQREFREAQVTLDAKNQASTAYDNMFTAVANGLTGTLRLAGKTELAAKIRPSTRRPGQTAEEAGDPSSSPTDQ